MGSFTFSEWDIICGIIPTSMILDTQLIQDYSVSVVLGVSSQSSVMVMIEKTPDSKPWSVRRPDNSQSVELDECSSCMLGRSPHDSHPLTSHHARRLNETRTLVAPPFQSLAMGSADAEIKIPHLCRELSTILGTRAGQNIALYAWLTVRNLAFYLFFPSPVRFSQPHIPQHSLHIVSLCLELGIRTCTLI